MRRWPLPNVWLGTSISDQASADLRIPHLLATPAAVRFVSAEPLLSSVDLSKWLHDKRRESILSASRLGPVQSRGRDDLAHSEVDGRRQSVWLDLHGENSGRNKRFPEGRLSSGDVQRWGRAEEGQRASDYLDDREPTTDPSIDGGQPYRRGQTEQQSGEFGDRDASTERAAFSNAFGPKEEGSAGGEKFFRDGDASSGRRDQIPMGSEVNDATGNRSAVRDNSIDRIGDCSSEELGALAIDLVIVGGESGPGALVWQGFEDACRSLRDQCRNAGVAFFMKQMAGARKSAMPPIPDDLMIREFPNAS